MYTDNTKLNDINNLYKKCTLCPRKCMVNRSVSKGYCGATDKIEISRIAPHYFEEPPISGKNGSGAIFFVHCNLGCVFCQNYDISRRESCGIFFSPDELAEKMLVLEKNGVHNINVVTATHYLPGIIQSLDIAKSKGLKIPVVYNCGGFESIESIKLLKDYVDIWLPDFKYFSPYYSLRYSNTEDYFDAASECINEMVVQKPKPEYNKDGILLSGVLIRHLVLPGNISDTSQVLRYIGKKWDNKVLVSLMRQYTPNGCSLPDELSRTVTDSEYECAVEHFKDALLEGFIQQKDSVGSDKIPEWNFII